MMKMLTPEDVADFLQVAPVVVRRWCRDGALRGTKLGKDWRVSPDWLKSFCESQGGAVVALHERLLTPEQAAEVLSISIHSVRAHAATGQLAGNKAGKQWRFSQAALQAYADGRPAELVVQRGEAAPGDASAPLPVPVSRGVSPRAAVKQDGEAAARA